MHDQRMWLCTRTYICMLEAAECSSRLSSCAAIPRRSLARLMLIKITSRP